MDKILEVMREMEMQDAREREQGLPSVQRMRAIKPEVGQFLYMLIRAMNAKQVVEVGTSRGYSSLWLGAAAQETGGRVVTFEIDAARAAMACAHHTRAGLGQVVRIVEGDALRGLERLSDPIDLLFLDAEKRDYIPQFDVAWEKVRVGGLVVADNVLSHAQELANYIAHVRALSDAMSMTVPVGRGEEVTVKLRA
jgi:predicted O-methyltransferase YrrM